MYQEAHQTHGPNPAWTSMTDVFAAHVRRTPEALAVEAHGEQRTYADLAARVDLFAARLTERFAGLADPEERLVGLCLARDIDLPAWLLAVFKAGAAYLPIDPTTPAIRLAHMLDDARPVLLVASRRYAHVIAQVDTPVIFAEDETDAAPASPFPVRPDTLAFVIFTSGSTGRPKGVEVEHGSLVALLATMADNPGFARGERMLGLTRISFDLSVPDMFLPFFVGGSLAIVDAAVIADPQRLAAAIDEYCPNLIQATPSVWRALLEEGWQGHSSLRILAGGEAMTRALADRLLPRCAALWNVYGPTEATVWSTICRVQAGDGTIPIGRPINGVVVHVADDHSLPLLTGEVGEIVIGGTGVARGYRNRPDLTADRFVMLADGTRAYRTGDLGRFDDTGALFCLGRLDDQVKVRGFRIELGDVEAALALHPAVAWSAVRLWTDPSDEQVLVGYLVPRPGGTLTVGAVRAFLGTRLAPYMIPDRIVMVATMPLTLNGKIDRAALIDPVAEPAPAITPMVQSDATITARLSAIWRDLLHVTTIAGQDDFFDLGGYSLMTVRLTRRIEVDFGVRLALVELMQNSTLEAMAARIGRGGATTPIGVMLLNAPGRRPPLFWLDAGPLMQTMTRSLSPDQPAFALNTDVIDEAAFGTGELSIPAIATCLRKRLVADQPHGPYYLGGWCRWGIVAYELAQQLIEDGEMVSLLVLLDAERPYAGPTSVTLRARVKTWLGLSARLDLQKEPASFSQRVAIAAGAYVALRYPGDVLLLRPVKNERDAGWGEIVDGHLQVEHIAGDHITMVRGKSVPLLAATLDLALRLKQQKNTSVRSLPIRTEQTTRDIQTRLPYLQTSRDCDVEYTDQPPTFA